MEQPTTKEQTSPNPDRDKALTREDVQRMNKQRKQQTEAPTQPNSDSDSNQ